MGLWTRRSEFGDKVGILGLRRVAAVLTAEVTCSALRERHPVSRAPAPPSSPTPPRGMALAVPPKTAAYQLFWREEAAVGGRRLQGGAGWRERERKKKKKRTKKKETLIRMKEKGGGGGSCTLPKHARRQRPDQAAHLLITCHWFLHMYNCAGEYLSKHLSAPEREEIKIERCLLVSCFFLKEGNQHFTLNV